jgi:intracellular septation protein A
MEPQGVTVPPAANITARGILLGSGPRFARDAFGPLLAFWLGWKLGGLAPGIALSSLVAVVAWLYERKRERPGLMSRISLVFVVVPALLGLFSGSEIAFLAPPVLLNLFFGLVFLGSAAIGRPLAGVFAAEMTDLPPEVRASRTYRVVFGQISAVWGTYMVVRSIVRLVLLVQVGVDGFIVINGVTGVPLMAALMTWSVWYGTRAFRKSEEWGWAFEPAPAPLT